MKKALTQGSIIEDIRSMKYPQHRCKGVVISARCDFAQDKLTHFHCLSALPLQEWIYEILYFQIVDDKTKSILGNIRNYCKNKGLDFDTLLELDIEKACTILEKTVSKKESKQISNLIASWRQLQTLNSPCISREQKDAFLKNEAKSVTQRLISLHNSNYSKYGFIPENSYTTSDSLTEGIVVDLQDIIQLDIKHAPAIASYKYDYAIVTDSETRKEINQFFFFEKNDDFVIADNVVSSPWIEHILHLFANTFTRVGVDNASDYEINEYYENFWRNK